jgi:hypothetical protein
LSDTWNLRQLPLKRCRYGHGHCFRTRSRETGRYLDGREVDLRQRRSRQERKCCNADKSHGRHQQRGSDRPANEWFRKIHLMLAFDDCRAQPLPTMRVYCLDLRSPPIILPQAEKRSGDINRALRMHPIYRDAKPATTIRPIVETRQMTRCCRLPDELANRSAYRGLFNAVLWGCGCLAAHTKTCILPR